MKNTEVLEYFGTETYNASFFKKSMKYVFTESLKSQASSKTKVCLIPIIMIPEYLHYHSAHKTHASQFPLVSISHLFLVPSWRV